MSDRKEEDEETVKWPDPVEEPAEEQSESLENDGTPGAPPPERETE
jgi:hypothetical protein